MDVLALSLHQDFIPDILFDLFWLMLSKSQQYFSVYGGDMSWRLVGVRN